MALSKELLEELDELVTHYPERRAVLIPALHRCQEAGEGWISPEIVEDLAAYIGIEPVEVWGVVTFYPMFRTTPRGKHLVNVCHNISCHLRGAEQVLAQVCKHTGAQVHGTSADGKFTVETVECQGACANAPMIEIGGTYYEDLDADAIARILGELQ